MNTSGIYPSGFKVLVKPRQIEEKTAGGVILPDQKKEKDEYARMDGTLIEVSPAAFTFADFSNGTAPKIGDDVIFSKYQAVEITGSDGDKYELLGGHRNCGCEKMNEDEIEQEIQEGVGGRRRSAHAGAERGGAAMVGGR